MNLVRYSGGSRPSDKGGGGGVGSGHPDPQIRGSLVSEKNLFFGPSGLSLV